MRTRLAPSPTGSLHLGNICTFVINWIIARQNNWEIVMRIEDIDGPRKQTNTITQTIDILQWIGLDWDGDIVIQSEELETSKAMLESLIKNNLVYHCLLTRKEIESVLSAPHSNATPKEPIYRPENVELHNSNQPNTSTNWRFITDHTMQIVHDELLGDVEFVTEQDFVVWTKNNMPAYQLAVVADDHRQEITHVVRGNDLLQSAAWQEQLYASMGWATPKWLHLPLIVGIDGKRLAKRHGDSRISTFRTLGVSPERIIGLLAMWTATQQEREPMTLETFTNTFMTQTLQESNIVLTQEDEAWLLE